RGGRPRRDPDRRSSLGDAQAPFSSELFGRVRTNAATTPIARPMKAATTVFRMVRGPTDDAGGRAGSTSVSVPTPTTLPASADGAGVGSAVGAGVWPGARLGAAVGFGVGLGVGPGRMGGGVDRMMSSWASAFAMSAACSAVSPTPVISTNVEDAGARTRTDLAKTAGSVGGVVRAAAASIVGPNVAIWA